MSPSTAPAPETLDSAALLAQMRPALVRYFQRKCRNSAEAEDLAQDVIVRTLARTGWTSVEHAKGYLFRAAVNRWHDRERRRVTHGTEVQWSDEESFVGVEELSPERVLGVEQELQLVTAALSELGERTRDVFMLARLEQMKYGEIATTFGISVSAVEKHLARALAHVARRLRSET
jgi:RNA polymerase sigma-70 factor (ECF subfamily)